MLLIVSIVSGVLSQGEYSLPYCKYSRRGEVSGSNFLLVSCNSAKELMEKASKNEITYEEAKELRRLLEKQRKEREEAGDIIGANYN